MKMLFDLLPVILFFITYKVTGDIYLATGVTVATSVIQIAYLKLKKQTVPATLWFSTGVIVVMGALTIFLHNDKFIMWKPTILYWGFALALIGARFLGKFAIRAAMQNQMVLPDAVWRNLDWMWAIFLLGMGGLNLYVAYTYSQAVWVNFKLFGSMGLMLIFVIAQGIYLARHLPKTRPTDPPAP